MNRLAAFLGVPAVIALFALMSRWVGANGAPVTFEAFETLLTSLPRPIAWLAAAIGMGWPLQRALARETAHPASLQVALGIAAMLALDATLGLLGLLTQPIIAWAIIVIGLALWIVQLSRLRRIALDRALPDAVAWTCAPGVAVLLIAACSAPGWLWSSEFGGYDALSYHLQLPREWLALGRMTPLEHNVYSFLPGYVEAAYLHLMSLHGPGPRQATAALYDCQMLHALLTMASAGMVGTLASRFGGRAIGALAGVLYLATPWTIVVGSLAYNEMPVNLMLAAGLLAAFDTRLTPARCGLLIGLFSAAATGAKLTSLGFVALPLGLTLMFRTSPRTWMPALVLAALAGAAGLLPWLLRNGLHAGNPLFPFATELLGAAHWTAEQVQAWHRGHVSDATLAHRITALWRQLFTYGFGANPSPGEPWLPQWSILPMLGVAGALLSTLRSSFRRETGILALAASAQIVFWLACTHLQSRFLIPAAVPLCALAAIGFGALLHIDDVNDLDRPRFIARTLLAVASLGLSILPASLYRREHPELGGAPALAIGAAAQQTGAALDDAGRLEIGTSLWPAVAVNWLLPDDARVLLVGEAAPLYYRLDRIEYATVWDRGPLSAVMEAHGDDPEAMRAALRDLGFTHVLVHPLMLDIWEAERWNDPRLTRRSVQGFLESAGEPLFDYPPPGEITIYALPE